MLCLFLFQINYTIYANHVLIKTTLSYKRYRFHYKISSDLDTFGSDSISVKNVFTWGKSSGLTMNKPRLVSFFVYRRQSRDRFRIPFY